MFLLSLFALLPFTFWGHGIGLFPPPPPPVPAGPLQGIYLTSQTVASPQGEALLADFAAVGGTMAVFDVQTSGGRLAYPSQLPLSIELENTSDKIPDLALAVQKIHDHGLAAVARFVLFKNTFLAKAKPEWTLKRKGTNRPFVSRDGPVWLDPSHPELAAYLLDITREIAAAGVDEVQFDYVRFPEAGPGGRIGYSFTQDALLSRDQALTSFVSSAAAVLHETKVRAAVDVFGIVVWDDVSWRLIGQNIPELAKVVDVIYPMPYPSHFGSGWGGHANPADEPYFFVQETTKRFLTATAGTSVKIRPWLQGFALRTTRFGPSYIQTQIRALADIGIQDFSVWNARNDYRATLRALKENPLMSPAAQ